MKIPRYISLTAFGVLAFFLFTGFLSFGKSKEPVKKQSIAILPVDRSAGHPLTAYVGKKFGQDFLEKSFGDKINLQFLSGGSGASNPEFVQKRIYVILGRALRKKKYEVLDPVRVFAAFNTLAYRHKEVDMKALKSQVPADAYFFITITYWDTDEFDKTGVMEAGYIAQLLDSKTEKMIWQKQVDKKRFSIRQNVNHIDSYSSYYDEAVDLVALDILRKFPKKLPVPPPDAPFEVQAQKLPTT